MAFEEDVLFKQSITSHFFVWALAFFLFSRHNEAYTWTNPTCCVHNIIVGKLWIEQYGNVEITNHKWDGSSSSPSLGSSSLSVKVLVENIPGGPVVKTLHFPWRGPGFDPWSENVDPTCHAVWPKKSALHWKAFPGSPVVKTPRFTVEGLGSVPDWGT